VPDVKWEDIGGLVHVKEELKETIEWPLKYSNVFKKTNANSPKGILLYGPPGTGKTLLAKAIANESGLNFISVKGPSLISKYVGESERGIREVFKKAKQSSPTILFFDEIDSLVPKRGESSTDAHVTERVISQFLAEMDGIEELKGVIVLAATNRLDIVDPAILRSGRFDLLFEFTLPDEETRLSIFKIHTRNKPLYKDVDLRTFAKKTDGMTGSDIELLCQRALKNTIRKFIKEKKETADAQASELIVTYDDFEKALKSIQSERP
jgi:transitional endoplasmic reticulum ATPase